jgi:hypothetical protein
VSNAARTSDDSKAQRQALKATKHCDPAAHRARHVEFEIADFGEQLFQDRATELPSRERTQALMQTRAE